MELRARFISALRARGTGTVADVTPSRMSSAVAEVLGASGAGLVMMQELVRWPVGASDGDARRAEQVQATVNEGPCLTAAREGRVVTANEGDIAIAWPTYHHELREHTPYRATVSFPVGLTHRRPHDRRAELYGGPLVAGGGSRRSAFAALDLYSTEPEWHLEDELSTIADEVVDLVEALLLFTRVRGSFDRGSWPEEWSRARRQVWISVGMLGEAGRLTDVDAIAILRGYAFARDLMLDDVADQLASGRLSALALLEVDPA